jgi:glycosyltransferase involved in cell wall biosynthesis
VKHVLIIAPQPFFSTRGTPINVRAVAETLQTAGYRVTILSIPYGSDLPGLSIVRVPRIPGTGMPPIGPSLLKICYAALLFLKTIYFCKKERIDLVHGVEEGSLIAGLSRAFTGVPYLADIDSCMVTQLRDSRCTLSPGVFLFGRLESFFLKRAVAGITVCKALSEATKSKAPSLPVFQIEDFPMEESLLVDQQLLSSLKKRFQGKTVILYTGNLETYQGIDLLLDGFAESQRTKLTGIPVVLVIVGGSVEKVELYKNKAQNLGISVVFVGARPASEMGAYMAASDLLISPRLQGENVPLKLYTYLASGKPLIATRILSHTQIVSEQSAYLGEPTTEGLAHAISKAVLDESRNIKADEALSIVNARYLRKHFEMRLLEAYRAILPLKIVSSEIELPPRKSSALS